MFSLYAHSTANITTITKMMTRIIKKKKKKKVIMGLLHPGPSQCSARLRFSTCWGAFTFTICTRRGSKVLHHHCFKRVICLLYIQTTTLCSRQLMTYSGMRAALSHTVKPRRTRLASILGWPRVNALSRIQPRKFC